MDAGAVAEAFDLGSPVGPPRPVQHSEFDTWQLNTATGRYLLKRLWQGETPDWWREHRDSMRFEQLAIAAGIRGPRPIAPVTPAFGWAARVGQLGLFRVYEWVDHRTLSDEDDITGWFGRTLATLHRLQPLEREFTPQWRWLGVYPPERWEGWIQTATGLRKPWAGLARRRLEDLIPFTRRVRQAHRAEHVVSHRDVGPWNVLVTDEFLLIDWESVGPVVPGCETGRAIQCFAHGDHGVMERLRDAYLDAGGTITCAPEDFMLDSLTDLLAQITERIRLMTGDYPDDAVPLWMDPPGADERISADLERFPAEVERLSTLGNHLLG